MIGLILGCTIVGITILYFLKIKQLSKYVLFSLPIGIVLNTLLFTLLALFKYLYNKEIFIVITILFICLFVYLLCKRKIQIENDLKKMPIWFLLFMFYIFIKLVIMASTSYFDFYNFDEFTAYSKFSKMLFIEHDFSSIVQPFTPLMYFIGTMVYDFKGGFDLVLVRTISPIFYICISLFIYQVLKEKKVNRHIAAFISSLFLVCSSEYLVLARTFYTNVIFSFYLITGIYLLLKNTLEKEDTKNCILAFILLLGACFTRLEGKYLLVGLGIYIFITKSMQNKKITKKYLILFLSSLFVMISLTQLNKVFILPTNNQRTSITASENNTIISQVQKKLTPSNLSSYFKNLYNQTFELDYYYFNTLAFSVVVLSIIVYAFNILKKKNKGKRIYNYINGLFFIELLYLTILLYTQLVLFKESEFQIATSFSRYFLSLVSLNFIICGIYLFQNTILENEIPKRKLEKIKNPKILLIIPAYNEEKSILKTYKGIMDYNAKNSINYDVIVINDGSQDNTKKILIENNIPHISLITNLGIGGAVQTGYKYALKNHYDIAVQFDGDGQHNIHYIKNVIRPIVNGEANLVIGSRFIEKNANNFHSTFMRRIGIQLISFVIKYFTNVKIYDTTSGCRACDANIIKKWANNYPDEYPEPITNFEILKDGFTINEVPVIMEDRKEGKSSIHTWKNAYYMINVILTIFIINLQRRK